MRYVATADQKEVMDDLKEIYRAASQEKTEYNLLKLQEKWEEKYPIVVRSWINNWDKLSTYFRTTQFLF